VSGFSSHEVETALGLPRPRLYALVAAGLVRPRRGPRGAYRFSFEQLLLLRAAQGLLAARIPLARVRRALGRLRQQLPAGRPLSAVRIAAEGDRVVVRDGTSAWQPESGQALLDFGTAEVAARVAPLVRRAARSGRRHGTALDAAAWFAWGRELESGAPDQAREAYRRALALAPRHAGALVALGRLLHALGAARVAEEHYRRALAVAPGNAEAHFALGLALEDQGRDPEALRAHETALAGAPRHAAAREARDRVRARLS